MIIDINEILDFLYCPLYYKFKATDVYTPYLKITEKYSSDIKKFMNAYNTFLAKDGEININVVKSIFGSLWIGQKNKDDFIFIDTGDNRDTFSYYRKRGTDDTLKYHELSVKKPYIPLINNYSYKVEITKGLYLTGNIDLISQHKEEIILVNYIPLSKFYTLSEIKNDINMMAMKYAYKKLFDSEPDKSLNYIVDKGKYIESNKLNELKFKQTIINIAKIIKNNLIYCSSYDRCYKCNYKTMCENTNYVNKLF